MKTLNIDIETIQIPQKFGYKTTYTKVAPIKHRRKKIDGINCNTKKANLIHIKERYINDNNFDLAFIYYQEKDDVYFKRIFNHFSESMEIITEDRALSFINNTSLF